MAGKRKVVAEGAEVQDRGLSKIDEALRALKKDYSISAINMDDFPTIPRWPLSSPSLSYVLGGGLPKGRVIEISGVESGGKSLLSTIMAADVQKAGGKVAYVDAECSFDPVFAGRLGLNVGKDFYLVQPEWGEQAFTVIEMLAETGDMDLIIVDSVSALVPKAEYDGDMGDAFMGLQARMMGQGLRKINGICSRNQTTVIFINQIRMKIGVLYGSPEVGSGGQALKFFASVRLDVRRGEKVGDKEDTTGIYSKIKCTKNKTSAPFRHCEIAIDFEKGIDVVAEYVNFGVSYNAFEQAGAWFTYDGQRFQGKNSLIEYFYTNNDAFLELRKKVDQKLINDKAYGEKDETCDED